MQNPWMDWNDLRHFLAVARTGTTLAASRDLRVSQSTVARRIAALEAALSLTLFDKRPAGYALTGAGEALLPEAEALEGAATAFADKAAARRRVLSGTVRLTTNEVLAGAFLMQAMRDFRATYPAIRLEIVMADRHLDLESGEADVALRAAAAPTQPCLVGRRIARDSWSLYCSRAYAGRHGVPRCIADLGAHPFIGVEGAAYQGPVLEWVRQNVDPKTLALCPNSVSGMLAAIRSGLGVGLMSDFVAARDADLVRCFEPGLSPHYEIWLLTHERLRHAPHVRAVLDYLGGYVASGLQREGDAGV
jgi:DNA-binding transcriptional LysR family regulator